MNHSKRTLRIFYKVFALFTLLGAGAIALAGFVGSVLLAALGGCLFGSCGMACFFAFGSASLMPDEDGDQ